MTSPGHLFRPVQQENLPQRTLRESMIEQWAEELDEEFEESGVKFNSS